MVKIKFAKSDEPEKVVEELDAFFTEAKLSKSDIISCSVNASDVYMTVIVIYDDGK